VAERSGAKTQFTGVTGVVLIISMIVFLPGLFRNLPQPILAAVVITASLSLADIPGTVRLWRQRKVACMLSIAAFLRQPPAGPGDLHHFFPTVEAAVTAFRAATGADWAPAAQPEAGPTTADPTTRT
jgi:hypothetical protein